MPFAGNSFPVNKTDNSDWLISEKSKLSPLNIYAKNCIKSEKFCKKIMNDNLLILRLSNVFGYENGKKKKPSLMSLILNSLKKREIIFDNNYFL